MTISEYLDAVRAKYESGQATEHSYRPALQALFENIDPDITVINEPKKSEAGMPDFLFERNGVPFGWAEAKDIDKDVIKLKGYSVEQRKRYEKAYPNLLYTNGVDFEFIREGESVHFVSIADFVMGLQPKPDKFEELERQLRLFAEQKPIAIRSAAKLAEMMAAKAAIIKDEIAIALADEAEARKGLEGQFKSFKANLLPNLTPDEFADIYAETITYGMFAARFHDDDLNTFSRQEAMDDLPASNPFLKGLFEYIAGPALPKRLTYIVDDLVAVMRASDPHSLFEKYGQFTARNDPFIHFYEDFLAAYNPKKRKSRGVWYTPEPVVDFIVRAVDDVLKAEFGLADGLADTSKVTVDWDTGTNNPKTGKPVTIKKEVHKVQILDPATGTGTFLAKAVQLISDRVKARAPGKWSGYVEQDLLPRLHGFELLMASYAMCHMKLDMQLEQTGYKPSANPPRLSVWLTNALEPAEREVRDLFFAPLADEARGASEVKRQTPIMCVIGNPPYSGISQNNGEWITGLIEDYKYIDGVHFGEKKHWLQDDYVKFIRFAEHMVQRTGEGVVGLITNHGYLDNPTFRAMRWHLLQTFDRVYVVDLHGNANKGEISPDGSLDKNVFDIMQGVAVMVAVKRRKRDKQVKSSTLLCHGELWGGRDAKNKALWGGSMTAFAVNSIPIKAPNYAFVPRGYHLEEDYSKGFQISEFMPVNSVGMVTARDKLAIDMDKGALWDRVEDFAQSDVETLRRRYDLGKDVQNWSVAWAKADVIAHFARSNLVQVSYRPLDSRWTFYTGKSKGFICRPIHAVTRNFLARKNLGMCSTRTIEGGRAFADCFVSDLAITLHALSIKEVNYIAPLYLYPDEGTLDQSVHINFHPKLYAAICTAAGIDPADQAGPDDDFRAATGDARPSEIKVFDYIYGVLHAPNYRETYAEFLKIDFPRIPYPASPEAFAHVSEKGEALRRLHLMEPAAIGDTPYPFEGEGDDIVAAGYPKFEDGKVWINPDQYFASVPAIAWGFPIGGYQPAQKWLKDRRGRVLSWDDIGHYQKIVKILIETDRIMGEIDLPIEAVDGKEEEIE
ncbi:type ISP restriction/modification enzyme [Sphingosinithalassobacter portus]|uniref:type ISP restriction/modification enzyme n=1 Tax=Stakelama portus TaxID=2676234 RepID=UPI0019610AAB|nr:type ISP restriction/modification enzyme [Sphingosinithalassobacter portus]